MQKTWFKPNNQLAPEPGTPSNRQAPEPGTPCSTTSTRYVRPTHQQLHLATLRDERGEFCHDTANIAREDCRNVMLLRPKTAEITPVDEIQLKTVKPIAATSGQPQPVSGSDQREGSYRFVDVDLAVELGIQAAVEHQQTHPHCDGQLRIQAQAEQRRGLAVSEALSCDKCDYKTRTKRLYSEVPRGSKRRGRSTAVPNMSLQIGLHNTGIATAGARRLLAAMGTAVPSRTGLQRGANKCADIIRTENIRDMAHKRKLTKDIHELQGFERDSPIAVEIDRQYNNPLRNCRKSTPFVPATQTRDTTCENVTSAKFVVMYHHESKLCKSSDHERAANSAKRSERPQHAAKNCTATRPAHFNMGDEKEGGVQTATKLLNCEEPLRVNRVTTDADGCLAQGLNSIMKQDTGRDMETFLDPSHLNRSLCAAISRANFSRHMFPGDTKTVRSKTQDRFADDVSHRVEAEAKQILIKCKGIDVTKINRLAARAIDAIPDCYMGDHKKCLTHSQVCRGKYKYPYLSRYVQRRLIITQSDAKILEVIMKKRIGSEAMMKTRFQTSTQKTESMNHAFSVTNPKGTLTFSRNGAPRDHSAIHLVNNGHANSIIKKCKAAGCPIPAGSPSATALAAIDKEQAYHRKRAKGRHYKRRRSQCRVERFHNYYAKSKSYNPGQLDPKSSGISCTRINDEGIKLHKEHNYSRMSQK